MIFLQLTRQKLLKTHIIWRPTVKQKQYIICSNLSLFKNTNIYNMIIYYYNRYRNIYHIYQNSIKMSKCMKSIHVFLKLYSFISDRLRATTYRWLSLSQSPGYQTKYFEISVVWDSQSVKSFTFFMNLELQLARKQFITVELRNVTDSTLLIHSKIVCDQCLFCTPFPLEVWYTLINLTQFLQHVSYVCCLHQRTPLNCVQSLKL